MPQIEGEDIRHRRLTAIPGLPPDLIDPPKACRFAPRCKYAMPTCTVDTPALREITSGHKAACIRAEEIAS